MKKFTILFILLITTYLESRSSSKTSGESVLTYDMYVPKSGDIQLGIGLRNINSETTTKLFPTTTKGSGIGQNLNFAYGLGEKISFFLNQDVYNYTYETSGIKSNIKSIAPTELGLKGISNLGGPILYYNVSYSGAFLEKRDDVDGLNVFLIRDLRDYFMPSIGFGFPVSMLTLGAKYDYFLNIKTEATFGGVKAQYDSGPGSRIKAYLQLDVGPKFGLAYSEEAFDSFTVFSNGSIVSGTVSKTELKILQIYAIVPVGSAMSILCDVQKINLKDESSYSKYDFYVAKLGAHFNF